MIKNNIYNAIRNTIIVSFITILFLTPILVKADVYLTVNTYLQQQIVEYPSSKFKAGTPSVVKPKILVNGGRFSYKRVSSGNGELVINNNSGIIDLGNSDPGTYEVTYKTVANSITVSISLL